MLLEQELIHEGHFLNYTHQHYINTKWKASKYEVVVRNKVNDIIAVLPVTEDKKVILIKQFRIPMKRDIIEIPAWIGDKENEEPIDILNRELWEEVGYETKDVHFCFESPTSQGMTNESCKYYIALDCKPAPEKMGHEWAEQIEVLEFNMETIFEDLQNLEKEGYMVDSKVYALLFWYEKIISKK